jgi:hypothetical protein
MTTARCVCEALAPASHGPPSRATPHQHVIGSQRRTEIATGRLFGDNSSRSMHHVLKTTSIPLGDLGHEDFCPANAAREKRKNWPR